MVLILVIGNMVDDVCMLSYIWRLFEVVGYDDKEMYEIKGVNYYYFGQQDKLDEVIVCCLNWMQVKCLVEN